MIWNHRCRLKQHSLPTCVIFGVLNLLLILAIWMMTATTDESDILNYQIHDGESHTPQTKHHHIASSITDNHTDIQRASPSYDLAASQAFPFRIFEIGFHKCGTRTMHSFMKSNGIPSIHWARGQIRSVMIQRYFGNESLLTNEYLRNYIYYSDFVAYAPMSDGVFLWQVLFNESKDSKFVILIRNINHWLRSRYFHPGMVEGRRRHNPHITDIEIVNAWKREWYRYYCLVFDFFEKMNASNRLLLFDIEADPIDKVIQFFGAFNLTLTRTHWSHQGRTHHDVNQTTMNQTMILTMNNSIFKVLEEFDNRTEYSRIVDFCAHRNS
eukprot:87864_1